MRTWDHPKPERDGITTMKNILWTAIGIAAAVIVAELIMLM